ncbi:hypothetical protein CNMCM7691_009043 [Aspergillus felis]|uniref:Ankyrin repeat protein n=1 Tax=Aspergillus felis TaxID=1287682 RepID=A0A8H6VAN3_9EURO|nr:hypothetical protein CNMCM7691_009043 [Aspergillus felis]
MAGQRAIYDATLACHQVLRDLGALPVLEEWAEDCLADLNLWANGAGALKVGKASLDARLSLNLDAKIFVVNLLRMLQGFVEKCVEIGSEVHNATRETSELSRAIQDVTDIVGQLSRITISIRKSGTNARIQKADASYDPDHPQIEALSQHLQLLLLVKPSKNGTLQARASSQGRLVLSCRDGTAVIDSDSLTAIQLRLIDANLKRRNRFLYAQRHAMKLSDRDQVPSTSIPAPRKLPLPPVLNPLKSTTEEHGMSKVHSATTATDVQDPIALPTQASAQPATTVISAISSRVTYPRPPLLRRDQNRGLEDLPAMGSGGETTENSRLTEEKIRCILENPNVKKDILHVFFNGIENQEDSSCATPVALHSIKDGWTPLFSASSNGHLEVKYVGDEGTSSDFPRNPTPTSKPETTEGDAVLISHLEPNRPDIANYKFEHPRLRDPWVEEQSKLPKMKIDPRAVEDVKFQESPSSVAERALQLLSSGPDVLPPPENLVSPPTLKSASPPQSIKDLLEPPVPQVEPCATPIAIYSIKDGCTPLYAASSNGHLELVKFLIKQWPSGTGEVPV